MNKQDNLKVLLIIRQVQSGFPRQTITSGSIGMSDDKVFNHNIERAELLWICDMMPFLAN